MEKTYYRISADGGKFSYTVPAEGLGVLSPIPSVEGFARKDVANSTPATEIKENVRIRTVVEKGTDKNLTVIDFTLPRTNAATGESYAMQATMTFRVPKTFASNDDIRDFATNVWTLLASNTNSGTGTGISTSLDSYLALALMGDM